MHEDNIVICILNEPKLSVWIKSWYFAVYISHKNTCSWVNSSPLVFAIYWRYHSNLCGGITCHHILKVQIFLWNYNILCFYKMTDVSEYLRYVIQHIKRDQLSPKIKTYFLLFPKWLFFQPNFGAKIFEIGHCILDIWQFHLGYYNRLVKKVDFEKISS